MGSPEHEADTESPLWPHFRGPGDLSGVKVITGGHGVWLEDGAHQRYLDLNSIAHVGHGREELISAATSQLQKLAHVNQTEATSPAALELARALSSRAPHPGSSVFLTAGGSEAVETALHIAKQFHIDQGEATRYKIIARRGVGHGCTLGLRGIVGGRFARDAGPLSGGAQLAPLPKVSGCSFCSERGSCTLSCVQELQRIFEHEGPNTIAAFLAEPISITGGVDEPHPDYWPRVRELCDRAGVLLIADEVFCGVGRAGPLFALERFGVKADLVTLGKGLSSGYAPLGAVLVRPEIATAFRASRRVLEQSFTFGGNPVSAAVGLANLSVLERDGLFARSELLGKKLRAELERLQRLPIVGAVRGGTGLLCAVDLFKNRARRERHPVAELRAKLRPLLWKHGLLGVPSGTMLILPPLCISEAELEDLVARLERALEEFQAEAAA